MKPLFDRWLPSLTLALWGGAILLYASTGWLKSVLAYEFTIYAIIAAVLLLIGAVVMAFSRLDASCCADSACGHGLSRSSRGRLLSFGIILLPVALAPTNKAAFDRTLQELQRVQSNNRVAIDDSRNLSTGLKDMLAQKFGNRPVPETSMALPGSIQPPPPLPLPTQDGSTPPAMPGVVAANPTDFLIRTPDGLIVAEVIDLLYAAQDDLLRVDFEGKKIQLIGQFLPDRTRTDGTRFKAVRMFMTCCAADARPIATIVETSSPQSFNEMEWVKIVGVPTFPFEKGRRISVLRAERVEKTEPVEESLPGQ